ncbi:MAG: SDR family oxidoreductase [Alphaproteobacteria bacterium]|nr:SDR family oxidoreductase [Alphaproteobacteria bacterium]MBU6472120.1 SDR family oxidoreductase [Alphaproteobacteria bacterium]MDE2011814.1 SDR family oxidoreductase [Alphaproteobacteria bacterium]
MRFQDKVVLVTGSTQGLGLGIARQFAGEGARVVVNGRHGDEVAQAVAAIRDDGGQATGIPTDISDSAQVRRMFEEIQARFGTVDILVNNAALTPTDAGSKRARIQAMAMMTTPIPKVSLNVTAEMSDETWQAMIATNLNGTFYCTREALKLMEPKRYGKIINIASIAGISGLSSHSPHYSASKGAIVAFTKSVALEVIGAGINVNCIAAGGIATEAWDHLIKAAGDAVKAQLLQVIPAGRMGTIAEFTSLALYLASDEAAYLVGQVISPNGGLVT